MAPDPDLASIPARVAAREHVVLRPSKRRKVGSVVLALWAGFVAAASAVTLRDGAIGLALLLPSVPLSVYWLAVAMPRSGALTLTKHGFDVRHAWITRSWDWDQITGFDVNHIVYPRVGLGIDLVGFATRDPRERPGDTLQQLAIRGLTRTTTLPDRFGTKPEALAEVMSQCRLRFADAARPDHGAAVEGDVARSRVLNAVTLVIVTA